MHITRFGVTHPVIAWSVGHADDGPAPMLSAIALAWLARCDADALSLERATRSASTVATPALQRMNALEDPLASGVERVVPEQGPFDPSMRTDIQRDLAQRTP
jgi:hypothetical protein